MLIRHIREIIARYRYAFNKNKSDSLYCSTSLSTSCAVPVIRIKRKIWMVETICFDTFHIDHAWFEDEQQLRDYLFILDTTGCIYEYKEYDIQL
jgi:hypothetical protein